MRERPPHTTHTATIQDGGSGGGSAVRGRPPHTTHTATIQDGGSGGGGAVRESVWSTQ